MLLLLLLSSLLFLLMLLLLLILKMPKGEKITNTVTNTELCLFYSCIFRSGPSLYAASERAPYRYRTAGVRPRRYCFVVRGDNATIGGRDGGERCEHVRASLKLYPNHQLQHLGL